MHPILSTRGSSYRRSQVSLRPNRLDATHVVKRPARKTATEGGCHAGIHPAGHIDVSSGLGRARNTSEPWHFSRGGHEEEEDRPREFVESARASEEDPCGSGYHENLIIAYSRRKPKRGVPKRDRRKGRRWKAAEGRSEMPTYDTTAIPLVNIGRLLGIRERREQGYQVQRYR